MVEDEQERVFRRNRRQIISVPKDTPKILEMPVTPTSTSPQLQVPNEPPNPLKEFDEQRGAGEQLPIRTKYGREVKKPLRLIEQY